MARAGRIREAMLVGAVLAPVLLDPDLRRIFASLDRPRRAALTAMVAAALAGQFALGARTFPFVDWEMYTAPVGGDPVVFEYDAVLRGGASVPLAFSQFLGTQSAGRLMEALRRQICRMAELAEDPLRQAAVRREHESVLRAIARRYNRTHPRDPAVSVLVSERAVALHSGEKGGARRLWEVDVA